MKICYNLSGDFMKVSLLGIGEELGLPSRKHHKQNFETRLLDSIEKELRKKYQVNKLNTFSYMFNKSWHISSILKNNLTLDELERIRRIGNDFAKKESLAMRIFSPKIKKETKENINLSTFLSNNNVILYDIGMNDFMYCCGTNVVASHILLHKNKQAKKILENEQVYLDVINGVRENIELLKKINPNSKIYVLGFSLKIYVPKFIYKLYKNTKIYKELNKALYKWNNMLKELEDIIFIDLELYNSKEEAINKIPPNILVGSKYSNHIEHTGISGMINDLENDSIHIKEKERQIGYLKKIL